jgi:uncharacterized membrane protein
MTITRILTLAGLVGTALIGGVCFCFGTAIMGSLQRLPAGQGAAAMNLINARIQNPLFLLIFMGTALICVALGIIAFVKDTPGKWWLVAGAALYLVGVIIVSFAINIPMNDKLATFDPQSATGAAEWTKYLANWTPANNVRIITAALAVLAFGIALASGAGSTSTAKSGTGTTTARKGEAYQGFQGSTLPNPGWQTPQQAAPRPQSWQ